MGTLVFCEKLPSADFVEVSLLKGLRVFREANQASRLPCLAMNSSWIRMHTACFPCNGREGMGCVGYFVKLATVPSEKTGPLCWLKRVPSERKKQSPPNVWAEQFLEYSNRKCSSEYRVHVTDQESFPMAWAALCFSCLSEVSRTLNFSSWGLLQMTSALLHSSAVFAPRFSLSSIFTWYKVWGAAWASRLVTNKEAGTGSFSGSDEGKERSSHQNSLTLNVAYPLV